MIVLTKLPEPKRRDYTFHIFIIGCGMPRTYCQPPIAASFTQVHKHTHAHAHTHTHTQTRTHTCIHTLMQNTGVIGARPPKEHSTSSHEQTLARVLEYVAMAGGLEAALTDDVAREEV